MEVITRKLHETVKEIEPTEKEWFKAIMFLTKTGQLCTDWRQEYILLSDVTGISMLVNAINNRKPSGASESTVLGPFHVVCPLEGRRISATFTRPRMLELPQDSRICVQLNARWSIGQASLADVTRTGEQMTTTLEQLEKRVSALEHAQKENKGTLEWVASTLGKVAATQDNHTARLDKLDNDLQDVKNDIAGVKVDVAGLRRDLPSIIAETMREVLKGQRGS